MTEHKDIGAIQARIAKAQSDSNFYRAAGDQEKYLEAYDQAEALGLQLNQQLREPASGKVPQADPGTPAVLSSLSHLDGCTVSATDGTIGHVKAALFDDHAWTIRYLVVDTGNWLSGRQVLISPYAVRQPLGLAKNIDVSLTRQQVKGSPDIDTHQPVSRQHERAYLDYYAYPEYWYGGGTWGLGTYPLLLPHLPTPNEVEIDNAMRDRDVAAADVHLRSSVEITGYDILASDASIGHVQDFIFEEESWAIRYLVVDTRNWWPGGRKVLLATHWIDRIDWASNTVHVKLTREQVRNSPEYQQARPIARDYEKRLHDAYHRKGYWD